MESRTVLNLKRRFGPLLFGEPRRVKLEAQIRAKDVVESSTVLDFKSRFSAGQRVLEGQDVLNLKPRFLVVVVNESMSTSIKSISKGSISSRRRRRSSSSSSSFKLQLKPLYKPYTIYSA